MRIVRSIYGWPMTPTTTMPAQKPMATAGLLALAITGLICIMTETLSAGLLTEIGADLQIRPDLVYQRENACLPAAPGDR